MVRIISILFAVFALAATGYSSSAAQSAETSAPASAEGETATAVFAAGCFWCVEQAFDKVSGVVETTSGYTGGTVPNPTYEQVSSGGTGHYEAVRVRYRPEQVSYKELLDVFWHNVDPFDVGGQFCDRGDSYLGAIFVSSPKEKAAAASKATLTERFDQPVVTKVLQAGPFYPAEDYHQNYYKKNPVRYNYYKWACGRAQRLEEIWGEPPGSKS